MRWRSGEVEDLVTNYLSRLPEDPFTPEQYRQMNAQSKPVWKELDEEIRNAWIQQTRAFYPLGSTTIAEATALAQYEYEQQESESLYPPVETAAQIEI